MGIVQKDALRTMILSYIGLVLGYFNKGLLFIKILSTAEIGPVNLLVSLGTLFGTFACLGMNSVIWKYFPLVRDARSQNRGILSWALMNSLLGTLVFTVILVILKPQIFHVYGEKSPLFVDYYYWIIAFGVSSVLYNIQEFYLRSLYHNVISVLSYEVVMRLLITISLLLFYFDLLDFRNFVIVHVFIYFVPPLIMGIFLLRKNLLHLNPRKIRLPARLKRNMFGYGLFTYFNSIGSLVILSLDALMLTAMVGLEATGVYTTITFLASALQVPYKSMLRVSSAIVAELWQKNDREGLQKIYRTFSTINLYIGLFMFLFIWLPRNEIFSFLPKEYLEGIPVFFFLMIGRLWDMYSGLNGNIFITSSKYRYDLLYTFILIVVVYFLNLWLIPIYGITGAAMAAGFAYVFFNAARIASVYAWFRIHLFEWRQLFILIFSGLVWAAIEFLPTAQLGNIPSILIKWVLLGGAFAAPIYFSSWLPEIRSFMDRGTAFALARIKRN